MRAETQPPLGTIGVPEGGPAAAASRSIARREWTLLAALTTAALLLRFVRLSYPPQFVFDETYFARWAHNYLSGEKFFGSEPPLGKFLIASGEWLLGYDSFGWRLAPALFGTAVIPLMYVLVKRLFGGVVMPTIAAILALLDGLLLVESRTAVIDIFAVFFNLTTYILFLLSLQAPAKRRSLTLLALTGVSLGLALAAKWITLAFLGTAVAVLTVLKLSGRPWLQRAFNVDSRSALLAPLGVRAENLHSPLVYGLLLGLVPASLYVAIFSLHMPFDSTGLGIADLNREIFEYHSSESAVHGYQSAWYSWPILQRPVAYYFEADGGWSGIVALGNPVIWWAGVAGLAFAVYRFARTRSIALFLVLFAFVAHYLPWSLIDRPLFIYHYLGALPFTIIALAYALTQSWNWRPRSSALQVVGWIGLVLAVGGLGISLGRSLVGAGNAALGSGAGAAATTLPVAWLALSEVRGLPWGKKQTVAFLGLAALAFVYFYPVWTGLELSPPDYYRRMWFRSWI